MLQVSKKHRFFGKNGALRPVSVCTFSDFKFNFNGLRAL